MCAQRAPASQRCSDISFVRQEKNTNNILENCSFCLCLFFPNPKRQRVLYSLKIMSNEGEKCVSCKKTIKEESGFKCMFCLRRFHPSPKCAPAFLFKGDHCVLPPFMFNTFVCGQQCAKYGILEHPVVKELKETNSRMEKEIEDLREEVRRQSAKQKAVIIETVDEMREQDIRRNNLVIFNVKESEATEGKERQAEDEVAIKDFFQQLRIPDANFEKCTRLGRKSDKIRPIKIRMISFDKKMDLLKKMNSMRRDRSQNTPNIVSDLTPYQREVRKNILVEFRERQQKGEECHIDWKAKKVVSGKKHF